jgi:hypothetical protein
MTKTGGFGLQRKTKTFGLMHVAGIRRHHGSLMWNVDPDFLVNTGQSVTSSMMMMKCGRVNLTTTKVISGKTYAISLKRIKTMYEGLGSFKLHVNWRSCAHVYRSGRSSLLTFAYDDVHLDFS